MGLTQRTIGLTRMSANARGSGVRPALLFREINNSEEKDLARREKDGR